MRTIKFKGTCIGLRYGGNIACGSLVAYPDGTTRIFEYGHDGSFNNYSVDPDTVCQFTGFLDKNGKEIYEGDILRSDEYPFSCMEDGARDNYFGIIEWSDEDAMFVLTCFKDPKSDVFVIFNGISDEITQQKLDDFEIVGDIHDPEWQKKLNLKDE